MAVDWTRRIATVVVGVPTAIQLLRYDLGMFLLAAGLCGHSLFEWAATLTPRIAGSSRHHHARWLVPLGVAICCAAWSGRKDLHDVMSTLAVLSVCCIHLATTRRVDNAALTALLLDIGALVYVAQGFSHAILLRYATSYGLGFQVLGLSCAWVCDSGALLAGSLLGHAKLAPIVSPGKTVVGAATGILASAATVWALFAVSRWMQTLWVVGSGSNSLAVAPLLPHSSVTGMEQIAVGLVLGVLCIVGDLVESFVKRVADVKDSGAFFPGHGGCLDRMDSFLFVAQALYYYTQFRFPTAT